MAFYLFSFLSLSNFAIVTGKQISEILLMKDGTEDYIRRDLERMMDDALLAAVRQAPEGSWISVRRRMDAWPTNSMEVEFFARAECVLSQMKVYIPVSDENPMPKDVYKCDACGGYTKNDSRGHCAACGSPRTDAAYYGAKKIGA